MFRVGLLHLLFLIVSPVAVFSQCVPQSPTLPATISRLGRTLTYSNVSLNSSGNRVNVLPGTPVTVSYDFTVSSTITACPGCITFFFIGIAGTCVSGSASSTTYPNTSCSGSIYAGQTGSSSASFTAPSSPGYYYITVDASWTYWCHQYAVNHNNCFNNSIGLLVVGVPAMIPPLAVTEDSLFNASGCGVADGGIYITPTGGSGSLSSSCIGGCYTYLWSDGTTTQDLENVTAGSYSVTVTDGACDTVLNFTITEPGFGFSLPVIDTTLCSGNTLVFNIGSGYDSIQWQNGWTDSIIMITSPGIYTVEIFQGLCSDRDSVNVNFDVPPVIHLSDDTLCEGDFTILNAGNSGTLFLWQDGAADSIYMVTQPGQYWVEVKNGACVERDSAKITFDNQPVIALGSDIISCEGEMLLLDAGNPGSLYRWQDGSTGSSYPVDTTGTYWVQVIQGVCQTADTIGVQFDINPPIDQLADTTLCENDSLPLDANYLSASSYTWQNGKTGAAFLVTQPGTYWVDMEVGACTVRDSLIINYIIFPPVGFPDTPLLCNGDSLLLDVSHIMGNYLWSDGSTTTDITVSQPGIYSVKVSSVNCEVSDTVIVSTGVNSQVDLGEDIVGCKDDGEIVLNAHFPGTGYQWQDGSADSLFVVIESGVYAVTVSNECGIASDDIHADLDNCECYFFLPKAFSPNSDGHNDVFQPLTDCAIVRFSFKIFNRWGEQVFESADYNLGWDGSYKGDPQPVSTYTWIVEYNLTSGTQEAKFSALTLVR